MTIIASQATEDGALGGSNIQTQFNLCFLYLYAGTVPATADQALDLVSTHTVVAKISNNSTATGITFQTPSGGVLSKTSSETWSGPVSLSGLDSSASTIAPTFFRLCAAGDDGTGVANASTGYRLQGTVGGPSSGADLQLGAGTLTVGDTQPIGAASITIT